MEDNRTIYEKILWKALNVFGPEMQITVCVEEMSELTKELCKAKRGSENRKNIAEEIADVRIMLDQMEMLFSIKKLAKDATEAKLLRLNTRIKEAEHEREA